jgi:hypothetical protein
MRSRSSGVIVPRGDNQRLDLTHGKSIYPKRYIAVNPRFFNPL